jgi:ubiquitin-conjugating enzyme E2 M
LEGKVCLNILRDDWKPVLDISAVINGLFFLFLVGSFGLSILTVNLCTGGCALSFTHDVLGLLQEPNPSDPLNKEAAEMMRDNLTQFKASVQRSLRGDMPRAGGYRGY